MRIALAILVAKEGLVAEGAGVGAAAGELDLGAVVEVIGAVAGEDVMEVMVTLDGVVGVVELADGAHVGGTEARRHVEAAPAEAVGPAHSRRSSPTAAWRVVGGVWSGSPRSTMSAPVFCNVALRRDGAVRADDD